MTLASQLKHLSVAAALALGANPWETVRRVLFPAARNGLLVLPVALAFPEGFTVVALVVVLGIAIDVVGLGIYRLVVPSVTAQSRSVLTPD